MKHLQGTTVAKLQEKLQKEDGKQVVCWSNGNIFRSVTLLAATWCEQNGCDGFDAVKALTKENLASFMSMLEFKKVRRFSIISPYCLIIYLELSNLMSSAHS